MSIKQSSKKDYFSILGVDPSADWEEIRRTYVNRVRQIHPDQFDFATQPEVWRKANMLLAELNEAYKAVRLEKAPTPLWETGDTSLYGSPTSEHRNFFSNRDSRKSCLAELDNLPSGTVRVEGLPGSSFRRLLMRQRGECKDHICLPQKPIMSLLGAASFPVWFLFLFLQANRYEWEKGVLFFYVFITFAVAVFTVSRVSVLCDYYRSTLKPAFYLTPLYFIGIRNGIVAFEPLTTLEGFDLSARKWFSSFIGFRATLRFSSHVHVLKFTSHHAAESFQESLKEYTERIQGALEKGDFRYFRSHNDFYYWSGGRGAVARKSGSKWANFLTLGIVLLASYGLLYLAKESNKNWFQDKQNYERKASQLAAEILNDEDQNFLGLSAGSLAHSQDLHERIMIAQLASGLAALENDFEGRGSLPSPNNQSGSSNLQQLNLPHGTALQNNYFLMDEFSFHEKKSALIPISGVLRKFHDERVADAPLRIVNQDSFFHLFIAVQSWEKRKTVLTAFIRNGQSLELKLPQGSYRVRLAAGRTWYGDEYLFGMRGLYGESAERVDLKKQEGTLAIPTLELSTKRK